MCSTEQWRDRHCLNEAGALRGIRSRDDPNRYHALRNFHGSANVATVAKRRQVSTTHPAVRRAAVKNIPSVANSCPLSPALDLPCFIVPLGGEG